MEDWLFNLEAKDWLEKNWFADELTRRPTNAEQLARPEEIHWVLEIIEKLGSAAYRLNPDITELVLVIHLADELIEAGIQFYDDNAIDVSAMLYSLTEFGDLHNFWETIGNLFVLVIIGPDLEEPVIAGIRPPGWFYVAKELSDSLVIEAAGASREKWRQIRATLPIVSASSRVMSGYSTPSHALAAVTANLSRHIPFIS